MASFDRLWRIAGGVALASLGLLAGCGDDEVPGPGSGGNGGGTPGGTGATISLLAGSLQRPGSQDGQGVIARFNLPSGVAQDSAGNAYVADTGNHTIRKVAADGSVTTLAGAAGQDGTTDGTGAAARFSSPRGIAIDASGNLFVADSGNHTVRKVTAAGVVTTVVGRPGQSGTANGNSAVARLQSPSDVAVDTSGNLYVVSGETVRKVTLDGTVSAFAASRALPLTAVAVDGGGNVYVAESTGSLPLGGGGTVRKLSSLGEPLPWGQAVDGVVAVVHPVDLAVDAGGNVLVTTSGTYGLTLASSRTVPTIQQITPAGQVITLSGAVNEVRTTDGPAAQARWRDPSGISVASSGRIVVTERETGTVRQISAQGVVSTLAGGAGDGFLDGEGAAARFFRPHGLVAGGDGVLYVADTGNRAVRRISPTGEVTTFRIAIANGSQDGLPGAIEGIAFRDNTLYVVVENSGRPVSHPLLMSHAVLVVEPSGRATVRTEGTLLGRALAVDAAGRVLVDAGEGVDVIDVNGNRSRLASGFSPDAIAVNAAGTVYVADSFDHTVRSIDGQGRVTLLAGQPGVSGTNDGATGQSRLDQPSALALDSAGNLYVSDASTIRKITPQGTTTTIAGVAGQSGVQAGPALAPLGRVSGLAWWSGALFATIDNAVIRIAPVN